MKGVLEFELPQEDGGFRCAVDGASAFAALRELGEVLRSRVKYGKRDDIRTAEDAYNEMRDEFFAVLNANGINLDG